MALLKVHTKSETGSPVQTDRVRPDRVQTDRVQATVQGPDSQGPDRQGPDRQGPDRQSPDRQGPERQGDSYCHNECNAAWAAFLSGVGLGAAWEEPWVGRPEEEELAG